MKKTRFILIPTLVIILSFFGCREKAAQETGTVHPEMIRGVKTAVARLGKIDITYTAPGTVRAAIQSTLTSKVMGNVTRIRVREGDRVKKGEILLRIESKEISARIAQAKGALEAAKAALRNAEANYGRTSRLYSRGSATRFELDGATLQRDAARGRLKQAAGAVREALAMKGYALIRAPANGRITRRHVEVGDQAAPGRPLLDFIDSSHLQFETFVPESKLAALRIGLKVAVIVSALGNHKITGRIAEMEPASDPVSHSSKIKLDLKGARKALPGMYGKAFFPVGSRQVVLAPKEAVFTRGQLTAVYVLDKKKVLHFRLVRTGKEYNGRVEILSGLAGGERVAVSEIARIEDGMEITQ
ncbi:MAG: efflux RND transporter periplasmic adaptor subunit [Deltaproteobacteria bacterium]|nr:efflux RND transporter periplasmic adaptor subunit [Deltaproteobacteria bacterium]